MKITQAFRPFVEKQVHDGEAVDEAEALAEDLPVGADVKGAGALGTQGLAPVVLNDRDKIERGQQPGRNPDLAAEEIYNVHIHVPQRLPAALKYVEQLVPIVLEKRRAEVGAVDGIAVLTQPRSAPVNADLRDETIAVVNHRDTQVHGPVGGQDAAAVPPGLLAIALAGFDIHRRVPGQEGEVPDGGKPCGRYGHYSIPPFSRASPARTMPLFELSMKLRMVSRSGDSGKPSFTRAIASEKLYP